MELTTLNGFLAALTVVVTACGAMLLGSLKTLRDSNTDLRARDADRELRMAEMSAQIVTLQHDRDALARQVRGDDKLDAFTAKLDLHHAQATVHWAEDEALLKAILDEMTGGNA